MNYIKDHIPSSTQKNRRPGIKMVATTITIHNTANPTSTARNERNWLVNPSNTVTASWHLVIDEKEAIEAIPLDEVAWHAGDGSGATSGNKTSIGIELCESGDQKQVWQNAVKLVAKMLHERSWSVDRVRTHKSWSGKDCPRLILPRWSEFIGDIEKELCALQTPQWKKTGIEYLGENGLISDPEVWLQKIDEPIPVWAAMTIMQNIHKSLKGSVENAR